MLANNSKRIRHRKLTRGVIFGIGLARSFRTKPLFGTKYRGNKIPRESWYQKNDSLLSSSARSTRIKRKKEEGEGGKETESDVEGGVKGGGKRKKKKESNASGIEFEKTWTKGGRNEAPSLLSPRPPPHLRNGN